MSGSKAERSRTGAHDSSGPPSVVESEVGDLEIRRAAQRDAEIILGLARHDEAALRSLIETCGKHVYGRALQILREPNLAEEVTQDTMLILWRDPSRFDPAKGSLRSFLIGVARFKAIDLVRHEGRVHSRQERLIEAESFFVSPAADHGLEDSMDVRAAIAELPKTKREVIFLAFYQGLTYREVAALLGLPEGTVKTRMRDALIKLRSLMALPETG